MSNAISQDNHERRKVLIKKIEDLESVKCHPEEFTKGIIFMLRRELMLIPIGMD